LLEHIHGLRQPELLQFLLLQLVEQVLVVVALDGEMPYQLHPVNLIQEESVQVELIRQPVVIVILLIIAPLLVAADQVSVVAVMLEPAAAMVVKDILLVVPVAEVVDTQAQAVPADKMVQLATEVAVVEADQEVEFMAALAVA
jgi:hypothetical protein